MLQVIFVCEVMLRDHLYIRDFFRISKLNFSNYKSDTYILLKQQIAKVLILPVY